jgi:uncharacterized protein YndB with AHSA1/START domain
MTVSRHTIDGRPALRLERRLPHPVERVWRAVSEPAALARWFVAEAQWTPAVGEQFEAAGASGRVTAVDPPRLLAWEWSVERYSFELEPNGDGCRLVFTHVFNPDFGPAWQHAAGWETYFNRLEAHLGGGHLSEQDAHAGIDTLMERYREQFASAGS